jgi:hypothetical protein
MRTTPFSFNLIAGVDAVAGVKRREATPSKYCYYFHIITGSAVFLPARR